MPRTVRKLLIVDSDAPLLRALGRALGREYQVLLASDTQSACAILDGGARFDVIVWESDPETGSDDGIASSLAAFPDHVSRIILHAAGQSLPSHRATSGVVVQKPASVDALRTAIEAVIAASGDPRD